MQGMLDETDPLSVPSYKNIEINQSVFGSYLWVSFFREINLQVLVLLCSCLGGFSFSNLGGTTFRGGVF